MYGSKFSDQWAGLDHEHVKSVWAEELSVLSDDEVVAGVRALVRAGRAFPPTLPEFFAICRPPLTVPPVTDHRALDTLALRYGISTAGCDSYHALRLRIVNHLQANDATSLPWLALIGGRE